MEYAGKPVFYFEENSFTWTTHLAYSDTHL
jgi:hypothetical protein